MRTDRAGVRRLAVLAALGAAGLGTGFGAGAAEAQTNWYAGGGLAAFDVGTGGNGDLSLGAVQARLGYQLLGLVAVEGEASFGIDDDDLSLPSIPGAPPVTAGLDSAFGGFAVVRAPLGLVNVFARAGYATLRFDAGALGLSASDDGSGPAFGVGADVQIFRLRGRFDWTRYEVDDGEADALALSVLAVF